MLRIIALFEINAAKSIPRRRNYKVTASAVRRQKLYVDRIAGAEGHIRPRPEVNQIYMLGIDANGMKTKIHGRCQKPNCHCSGNGQKTQLASNPRTAGVASSPPPGANQRRERQQKAP